MVVCHISILFFSCLCCARALLLASFAPLSNQMHSHHIFFIQFITIGMVQPCSYVLYTSKEIVLMDSKPIVTHMDPNAKLLLSQEEPLSDPKRYKKLVGKLNYLTISCSDISFAVSMVSLFLNSQRGRHWNVVIHILNYIKGILGNGLFYGHNNDTWIVGSSDADWADSSSDKRSTFGYCVFICDNLIS